MLKTIFSRRFLMADTALVSAIALLKVLLHFFTNAACWDMVLRGTNYIGLARCAWTGATWTTRLSLPFSCESISALVGDSLFASRLCLRLQAVHSSW